MGLVKSFRRVRALGFADRFYERLLAGDPAIRAMFEKTDFTRQKELLLHGILMIIDHAEGRPMGTLALERLAERHVRLKVTRRMFDNWIDCVVVVVRELDPECDAALARRWESAMKAGVDYMVDFGTRGPRLDPESK
jgi:hemoglobin-like flavoprotein